MWCALACSVGCGTTVVTNGGDGGGTTTGGVTSGNGVTTSSGSAGNGGAGGVGAGGADVCASYADEPPIKEVRLSFRNDTPITIYMPDACGSLIFGIVSDADELSYDFVDDPCLQSCGDLQNGPGIQCELCEIGWFEVPPFSSVEWSWHGQGLESVNMPQQCWAAPEYGPICNRKRAAGPATYTLSAWATNDCGDCVCDNGFCYGGEADLFGEAQPSKLIFPEEDSVEVVFETCTFGCP